MYPFCWLTQFIRTVSEVRTEWLLECAPAYYDPRTLDGELKRVFEALLKRKEAEGRSAKKMRR